MTGEQPTGWQDAALINACDNSDTAMAKTSSKGSVRGRDLR